MGEAEPAGTRTRTEAPDREGTLTATGVGEVVLKPDSMRVMVGVESEDKSLDEARAETSKRAQQITQALKGLNVPNLTLKTQNVELAPVRSYRQGEAPTIVGYRASNVLLATVTATEAEQLADFGARIVDAALDAGANDVGSIEFYVQDPSDGRARALQAAVRTAIKNAHAMAEAAGVSILRVQSIQSGGEPGGPIPVFRAEAALAKDEGGAPPTPIEAGEVKLTSTVTLRFAIGRR